jgi:BirA family biotin operon repressor/biotin-[acetyl-CoA-carboxylase] ligase
VGLKWPNDLLTSGPDGGKLAGILAEFEPGAPEGTAVVLGIGLNLAVEEFPEGVAGASLHRLCGRQVAWEEALAALVEHLGTRMKELERGGISATVAAWRERAVGIGTHVVVTTPRGPVGGVVAGIDDDGALLLDTPGGTRERVLAGDVSLRR